MKTAGKGLCAIALQFEVSINCARFHLNGSASMKAALAQGPALSSQLSTLSPSAS